MVTKRKKRSDVKDKNKILPDWFWDLANKIQNRSDFEFDVVYNIYDCGVCAFKHTQDKMKYKYHTITENGEKRQINRRTCDCDKKGNFLIKFKICSICKKQFTGTKLLNGLCIDCRRSNRTTSNKNYFQNGKPIIINPEEYETYSDCVHRSRCLWVIVKSKEYKCYLHCGGCPDYEKPEY